MSDARAEARRRLNNFLLHHRPSHHVKDLCFCGVPVDDGGWVWADHVAGALAGLFDVGEEWRVEGEDDAGEWVTYAEDRDAAIRCAAKQGGKPVMTLMLSLPVEPVSEEATP